MLPVDGSTLFARQRRRRRRRLGTTLLVILCPRFGEIQLLIQLLLARVAKRNVGRREIAQVLIILRFSVRWEHSRNETHRSSQPATKQIAVANQNRVDFEAAASTAVRRSRNGIITSASVTGGTTALHAIVEERTEVRLVHPGKFC